MKQSDLIQLVKDVLGGDLGEKLLNVLKEETINRPNLFTRDIGKLNWRVGQLDLVNRLVRFVSMDANDLDKIRKEEKLREAQLKAIDDVEKYSSFNENEFGDFLP
jgi:hypothetical protein